jgi:hypothetical protein
LRLPSDNARVKRPRCGGVGGQELVPGEASAPIDQLATPHHQVFPPSIITKTYRNIKTAPQHLLLRVKLVT